MEPIVENPAQPELNLYRVNDEYIACLNNKLATTTKQSSHFETVIILDRSGSMAMSVFKIVHHILPHFFEKLNYDPESIFHLIAFESRTKLHKIKIGELKDVKMFSAGGTMMSPAVEILDKLFKEFKEKSVTSVRILTISDGMICDQMKTKELGDKLADFSRTCNISVNSQAIRFFTSFAQPDTTALCSLLQLNNVIKSSLTDVKAENHHEKIAVKMAELFVNDGFDAARSLTCEDPIFRKYPWDEEGVDKLLIFPGKNVFWMKELPGEEKVLSFDNQKIVVKEPTVLTLEILQDLLNSKLDFVIDQMKILKVVNSESAKILISKMLDYFTKIDDLLNTLVQDEPLDPKKIADRFRLLRLNAIRNRKISTFLATISNDDKVHLLNAAQKAAYLRSVEANSKAGRGLAKRAAKKGGSVLGFDEIAREQSLKIAEHFDEVKDIDDSTHLESFYSRASTLEGIRTLVDIAKDPGFVNLDANEILQILNIVGLACHAPVGDFPDASSWRINELYPGVYVSVADIITSYAQSKDGGDDKKLLAPGYDKEITSVVPIFDDPRIGVFLKTHAPALLEYASSIGMRRVIADVPMTFGFNIISGIRRLMYDLNKNKSTLHVETFKKFVDTAAAFIGKYYDHIEEMLRVQDNGHFYFYLANNGIANMIIPLIRFYHKRKHEGKVKVSDILRSTVNCEVSKAIGKEFKEKFNFKEIAKKMLYELLGVDVEKNRVKLNDLFVADEKIENVQFACDYKINEEYLEKLSQPLYYLNYITLLPKFLEAVFDKRNDENKDFYIDAIKSIPEMSKVSILEAYDVKCSYKNFIFLNIFQALKYPRCIDRADKKESKMKVIDVKFVNEAFDEVKAYVAQQYRAQYEIDLKAKRHKEENKMAETIVEKIINSKDMKEVIEVWKGGVAKNDVTYKISNSSSAGFKLLCRKLVDLKAEIPLRAEVIEVLLIAKYNDEIVYNNGEPSYLINIKKFKKRFLLTKSVEEWMKVEDKFVNRGTHKYRESKANRHGYGLENPSFYGLGFNRLEEYLNSLSTDEARAFCDNSTKFYVWGAFFNLIDARSELKYENIENAENQEEKPAETEVKEEEKN